MSARKRRIKSKRLSIAGFLEQLRKHKSAHWFLLGGSIRCKGTGYRYRCPLTYVAWPDEDMSAFMWREAAQRLHIPPQVAQKIIFAADVQTASGAFGKLRRKMLRALDL